MENKELEVGDIVVVMGCEECYCHRCGKIFEIHRLHTEVGLGYTYFCRKAKRIICTENIAACKDGTWFPVSWLRTYSHFRNWHGK